MLPLAMAGFDMMGGGGMFGDGLFEPQADQDQPTTQTVTSGGPFVSGAMSFGGKGIDTTTILVIGGIALAALFLWMK